MSRKGRPNFEATADERKLVEMVAGVGLSHEQICFLVLREGEPISVDTLSRHFADELVAGKARTIAKVAGTLVKTALGPPSAQATASQIFFLKTQAGWRETIGLADETDRSDEDDVATAASIAGLLEKGRRAARAKAKPRTIN